MRWYFPFSTESNYAMARAMYRITNGGRGEKPIAPAQRQSTYDEIVVAPDPTMQKLLRQSLFDLATKQ